MTIRKLTRSLLATKTPQKRGAEKTMPPAFGAQRIEALVHTLGVVLALASAGFASTMIMDADRKPQFAGLEHLAIYSRPTTLSSRRSSRAETSVASRQAEIDYTPVGAISADSVATNYTLLAATAEYAIIRGPLATVRLERGDVLPKLGRVTSIEHRAEGWIVVTESGQILREPSRHDR